ncbi:MAG: heavy-metal-associated domain-containing protein [Symploca sp. SIO3C6]|uniref:Probable copper-transporting ATPase PacS n=1 Tax=Symploca sp. SIO1C4 TaxID=2607765 RepID=A0A6B3NA28_9CYAN|nr:heavy-metal-associated domain-containing protein [Symploca sp. SIO3C6]NER29939.1 heavy-metal-associated domain-containing protein [Symploca sp. SIO1C4]NET04271.1 heavy-metal-associated domain-containing protein [Symploca sp. SIO2B6]
METIKLKIEGMGCNGCAAKVEKLIQGVAGVIECNVNFEVEQATVSYNPQKTNFARIQQAVKGAGYGASPTM